MDASPDPHRSSNGATQSTPFDGSPTWSVRRVLRDGTPIMIRPILPEDREELRREFRHTSAKTRYLRFLGVVGELSEAMLTYLTCVDQKNHICLVATMTSPDLKTERGIGVARLIRLDGTDHVAEAAVTVVDDMQQRGVGSLLVHELEGAARASGIRVIRAEVLADNATMRDILASAGAVPLEGQSSYGTVSYDIELERVASTPSRILHVLRGAAQTMAMTIRKLTPH